MDKSDRGSWLETLPGLALIGTTVIVLGWLLWLGTEHMYPNNLEKQAQFGTALGGINTFFGALAFAALTVTLLLQRRALAIQQAQMISQQEELAEQNERLRTQAFESMLFQLLGLHHEIARDVKYRDPHGERLEGREAIRRLADEVRGEVSFASRRVGAREAITVAQEGYENFYANSLGVLDHYFRNLYHIFKFIDTSGMPDPRRYTSLVRAQLSRSELVSIFYNGISPHGEKFKPLIEKYALLENMPNTELPVPGHMSLYLDSAYEWPEDAQRRLSVPQSASTAERCEG